MLTMIQSGISYSQPKVGYKLASFKRHLELTFFLVLIKLVFVYISNVEEKIPSQWLKWMQ